MVRLQAAGPVVEVEVPGATGADPLVLRVRDGDDPAELVRALRAAVRRGGVRLRLELDPARPWPAEGEDAPADAWSDDLSALARRIDAAASVVVLAGPGVVWDHAVPGLQALATTLGAGVLNTWGAKGIFHWRSRHHWATIGLQEEDFRLGGLAEAELVVATGLDDREAPDACWADRPHVVVAPEHLAPLAEALAPRAADLTVPPLRARLAAATQAGWAASAAPLAPSRVTLAYGRRLAGGGLVAADAGVAGFWVARTFATTELGMVAVPAQAVPGWAAACVAVSRLAAPLRPALGVLDDGVDEASAHVVDFAAARGVPVGLEVWGAAGDELDAPAHEERLRGLADATGPGGVATLATDAGQLAAFVEAAGPVTAWRPPPAA